MRKRSYVTYKRASIVEIIQMFQKRRSKHSCWTPCCTDGLWFGVYIPGSGCEEQHLRLQFWVEFLDAGSPVGTAPEPLTAEWGPSLTSLTRASPRATDTGQALASPRSPGSLLEIRSQTLPHLWNQNQHFNTHTQPPWMTFSLSKKRNDMECFFSSSIFFFFFSWNYTVQSIPIRNLEIILFFLFKGGSGTQCLKAFPTARHATANWWGAGLHEYASGHPTD